MHSPWGARPSHSLIRAGGAKKVSASRAILNLRQPETLPISRRLSIHQSNRPYTATMSSSRTPFVCASCTKTLRQTVKPNAVRSFSTTVAKSAGAPSPDQPRWKQTPPQMRMPFRLRPQPSQPLWKVNEQMELVDDTFDKFVGQAGGRGTRGREVLPEEIKVRKRGKLIAQSS